MKSMTAYAKSELEWQNLHFSVEIRTLNHRYRDIILKLPQRFLPLEENVRQLISSYIFRGRVDCIVKISGNIEGLPPLSINWEVARTYYHLLKELKNGLGLKSDITLDMFLGVKDIFITEETKEDIFNFWPPLKQVLEDTLKQIDIMRQKEGESLKKDIEQRLSTISIHLNKIEERVPEIVKAYRQRLYQRVKELLNDINEERITQEVVFFAERSDITEEIVRLKTHIKNFNDLLEEKEAIGRKLDFLLQEMHREANTMGAKANDVIVSQQVVEIKTELEKIRQQLQNIE
ncbi:MAG: YicC family protein [Candidatus Desulfofervidus auxilii]|nr:YicC family protein [Candidatus Desulfofervidus auxilii]